MVAADRPASKVLQPGDRILAVNGDPITRFYDFIAHIRQSGDKTIQIELSRKSQILTVAVTPKWNDNDTPVLDENLDPTGELKRQATIGISMPRQKMVKLPVGEATVQAITEPARALRSVVGLFSKPKDFDQTVSGPATMVLATNEAVTHGPYQVLWLSAILSISVGIFNLLPFAPLDGGQMFIAFAEMLRGGKRLSMQVQTAITAVGAMLVVALVLSAWFVDFRRQFGPPESKPLRFLPTKAPDTTKPAPTAHP
jgi:regulator of sigma E protease